MKNYGRYLLGGLGGMIGEYLYRVEFNIIPLIVGLLILSVILFDLAKTDFTK